VPFHNVRGFQANIFSHRYGMPDFIVIDFCVARRANVKICSRLASDGDRNSDRRQLFFNEGNSHNDLHSTIYCKESTFIIIFQSSRH